MKLHYHPATDSLYIDLTGTPGIETREVGHGLVADFDAAGNVVGFDIDQARPFEGRDDRPSTRSRGSLTRGARNQSRHGSAARIGASANSKET